MKATMYWAGGHGSGGGHAPSGIGPIENIGPGGKYGGQIVGLVPALKFFGDIAGPGIAMGLLARRQRIKEYNDRPGQRIVGTAPGGQVIKEPSGPDADDEWYEAHTQSGHENRAAYQQRMGTPKHRPNPRFEEPLGPEPKKKNPLGDTSDLRKWTP
jgi:hypothetical protein